MKISIPVLALVSSLFGCGKDSSPTASLSTGSVEQAVSAPWSEVMFAGSFHLGGRMTGGNAGQFEVDFVELSDLARVDAGHGGNWTDGNVSNPDTWDDPNGVGEIHFSNSDLGPAGGFVLLSPQQKPLHGSYVVGYWCINSATGVGRSTGATANYSGTTFVSLTCNSGEYSALFTGSATFHAGN